MMVKRKSNSAWSISALAGLLFLFVLAGCKTPPPAEAPPKSETAQVDTDSESVAEAPVAVKVSSEAQAKPGKRGKKMKPAEAKVTENTGPGDGAPPAAETKSKVEEMEQSLAPLQAVPVTPPS